MTAPTQAAEKASTANVARDGVTVNEPSAVPGDGVEPHEPEQVAVRAPRPHRGPAPAWVAVYGAVLSILAALVIAFAADLSVVGAMHHNRDQRIAYASLRQELANGTAPVGPADYKGHLLAQGAPVALLSIPQIGLSQVVFEGTTSRVLAMGPGHERLTPMPGQVGTSWLMGRRAAFGGPFRDISRLRKNDEFTVTTGQGVSTYRVLDVRRAGDPQPPVLASGAGRLQLITATGPAYRPTGVLRVDADLVTPAFGTPTSASGIPPLSTAELPLKGDSSVLIVLVLWAQALLIAAALTAWARVRWGFWQSWIVGLPLLTVLGLTVADRVAQLLPNLM